MLRQENTTALKPSEAWWNLVASVCKCLRTCTVYEKPLCVCLFVCAWAAGLWWQLSSSKPERRLLISAGGHWGIWQQSRRFHNCLITVSPLEQITSVGSPFVLHCWSSFRPKLRATTQRRWLIKRGKKRKKHNKNCWTYYKTDELTRSPNKLWWKEFGEAFRDRVNGRTGTRAVSVCAHCACGRASANVAAHAHLKKANERVQRKGQARPAVRSGRPEICMKFAKSFIFHSIGPTRTSGPKINVAPHKKW